MKHLVSFFFSLREEICALGSFLGSFMIRWALVARWALA